MTGTRKKETLEKKEISEGKEISEEKEISEGKEISEEKEALEKKEISEEKGISEEKKALEKKEISEEKETLEGNFQQLEEITAKMQEPGISLDDAFLLYQRGMEKLKNCSAMLDEVEKKMQILNGDGTLTDF